MDSTTNAALNFALVQGRVDAEEYADIRAMACRRGDRALPFVLNTLIHSGRMTKAEAREIVMA